MGREEANGCLSRDGAAGRPDTALPAAAAGELQGVRWLRVSPSGKPEGGRLFFLS